MMLTGMTYEEAWDLVFHGGTVRDVALWSQQLRLSVGQCVAKFWDDALEDANMPDEDLDFADMATEARLDHEARMVKDIERELNWATAQAMEAVNSILKHQPSKVEAARLLLKQPLEDYGLIDGRNDKLYVWQVYESLRNYAREVR